MFAKFPIVEATIVLVFTICIHLGVNGYRINSDGSVAPSFDGSVDVNETAITSEGSSGQGVGTTVVKTVRFLYYGIKFLTFDH